MTLITRILATALVLATLVTHAEDWELSLGLKVRDFAIDFSPVVLTNDTFAGKPGGGEYIAFRLDLSDPTSETWEIATNEPSDGVFIVGNPAKIQADHAMLNSESSSDDGTGVVLTMSRLLTSLDNGVRIDLDCGLSYVRVDSGFTRTASQVSSAAFTIRSDLYTLDTPDGGLLTVPLDGGLAIVNPDNPETSDVLNTVNDITAQANVDATMIWLDIGLRAALDLDRVRFELAAGPTINYAEVESDFSHTSTLDETVITGHMDDSDEELFVGLYGAAGVALRLTDQVDLGVRARYDWGSDIGTHLATIDVDGESYELRVTYRF